MRTQAPDPCEWIDFLIDTLGAQPSGWDNDVIARRNQHAPLWLDICAAAKDHLAEATDATNVKHLIQATETLHERFRLDSEQKPPDPWAEPPVAQLQRCATVVLQARGAALALPEPAPGPHVTTLAVRDAWLRQAALDWTPGAPPGQNWLPPDAVPGLADVEMPVLLVAQLPSSGSGILRPVGVQAQLTLRAVEHKNACLHLVPAPRGACTALQASMAGALQNVQAWLWATLRQGIPGRPVLADMALCWDLHFSRPRGEDEAGITSLTGPSASATLAVAAAKLLEHAAPAYLAPLLRPLSRDMLRNTWITADLATDGQLGPVGAVGAKRGSLALMLKALAEGAGSSGSGVACVHVAKDQSKVPDDPPPPGAAPPLEHEDIDQLLAFLARQAEPPDAQADALLQALLGPDERPAVPDATLVHVASHMATPTLPRWLLKCWAQWARRAGGQVHARYVPLAVEPDAGSPGQSPVDDTKDPRITLQSLLEAHDATGHHAYVLRGRPGAGKTTLMRHHLMVLCRTALQRLTGAQLADATVAAAAPIEVPLYLPLATLLPGEPPLAWARNSLRNSGAPADLLAWLDPKAARPAGMQLRLMLDGINELQVDANQHELREDRAAETLRALREALAGAPGTLSPPVLPGLLSIRLHHADSLTGLHLLPVRLLDWTDQGMRDYLALRFPSTPGTRDEDSPWWPHWQSLSELRHGTAKAMCRVPLQLAGQCDLWAHGFPGTLTNRSALYTAWLWLRLRRALGHDLAAGEQHTPEAAKLFKRRGERWRAVGLLSKRDCRRIASTDDWLVPHPDALPRDGSLLQHLMRHAEEQYRDDADAPVRDAAADTRAGRLRCVRVDLPVHEVATWISDSATRRAWLDAVAELGLAHEDETSGLFGFTHPSWGEFLASVRLLPDTPPPQTSASQRGQALAAEVGTQPAYLKRVLAACAAAATVGPEDRNDAAEIAYLNTQGSPAWQQALPALLPFASPSTPLPVPMARLLEHQKAYQPLWADGTPPKVAMEIWESAYAPWFNDGVFALTEDRLVCHVHLRKWGDRAGVDQALATGRTVGNPGAWAGQAAGWQFVVHNKLWPPVREALWAHLQPQLGLAVVDALREQPGRLRPTAQHDIDAVLSLALEGQRQQVPWLVWWLLAGHGARLAPAIPALLAALEPAPQAGQPAQQPSMVLQHWRRLLLLDALNTGPAAVRRLRYGRLWHRLQGALRPAQASSPPAPQSQALQDALDAHWQSACQQAQQSGGLDLRQRMEAARMLGLLGDTLRYVRADTPVQAPALGPGQADPAAGVRQPAPTQPRVPAGLRLHSSLWVDIGRMGQPTAFFIGSRHLVSHRSERPVRVVWLPGFQAASLPVTVAEWRQFVLCGGCADPEAPWWREAGPAAQGWLRDKRKGAGEQGWLPWFWDRSDHDEPLLPATGITLFEALAYARWAELLHQTEPAPRGFNSSQGRWQVRVPTELQWEAMARGPTTGPLWPTLAQTVVPTRSWAHRLWHVQPQALDFNHATTRWGRPSPVGVFSGSQTPLGLDDMAGNTWDWCCSALNEPTRLRGWRSPADCTLANTPAQADDDNAQRAWRGGSFRSIAGGCRAAVRSFSWPGKQDGAVGLRLVRTWVTGPGS